MADDAGECSTNLGGPLMPLYKKELRHKDVPLVIKTEIIRRYYVESPDGWIYAGPFEDKDEARRVLRETRRAQKKSTSRGRK
jgi:hypothetical protein